jgi:uncharacterized membrane protein
MKKLFPILTFLISFTLFPSNYLLGQDEGQSGSGDSAAEASVTGSASQKAVTAPEALEGNPVVSFLKQGVSLQKVSAAGGKKALKVLVEAASSFSEFSSLSAKANLNQLNLSETVSLVNDAKSKGVSTSLNAIATRAVNIKKLDDSGLTGKAFTDALAALRDTSKTVGDNVATTLITLADDPTFDAETFDTATLEKVINGDVEVKDDDTIGGSFSVEKATFAANVVSKGTEAGLTVADADAQAAYDQYKTTYSSLSDIDKDTFETKVANSLGKLVGITTTNDDGTISNAITISSILNYTPDELEGIANITDTDARHDVFLTFAELYDLQDGADNTELITEITSAAKLLNAAFVDRTISGDTDLTELLEAGTLISYNAAELAGSGITKKAASIAEGLGLFGKNGTNLLAALPDSLSVSNITEFNKYLLSYTGSRDLGDNDLSKYELPLGNLNVLPGKNIKLEGNLDVSTELSKVLLTDNNVEPADIKLLALASAKDFTITGDLTIKNTNEVEDHGLALVAADDFYLRSEYSSANSADYNKDTTTLKLTYEGSNLAIASVDSMHLVNVDIKTGGNLAIGTLDELHIGIDGGKSSISAGTGGNTPNPDLVLLYANDLITLNNVDFVDGMIREIHLDAPMMELRNLAIPSGTLVKGYAGGTANNSYNWASKELNSNNQPYLQFERANLKFSGDASSIGDVILDNITHGSIDGVLTEDHFDKTLYTGS